MSTFIRILSNIFPVVIANRAYRVLNNPQVRKLRPHEQDVLDTAETADVRFKSFKIKLYRWGDGKKPVLLVHGWEGQAGNYADMIPKLLERGLSVITFDGPSHGHSSVGETSPFEFSELVGIMIRQFRPALLVSHSFGSVATTYALYNNQDVPIEKYVLLTTPDRFLDRVNAVADAVGISDKSRNMLIQRIELETGLTITDFNVSSYVPHVNVKEALILHDVDDKVVPLTYSKQVKAVWPNAQLEEVQGTGHFRIMRDERVIDRIANFLS